MIQKYHGGTLASTALLVNELPLHLLKFGIPCSNWGGPLNVWLHLIFHFISA